MDYLKDIHIGKFIKQRINECSNINQCRIESYFNLSRKEIFEMLDQKTLDTEIVLKWSKLLEYDFFRLYSQYLILYSPISKEINTKNKNKERLPIFRKNIYSKEIIDFVLMQITSGSMTKKQIIDEYKIPKTTLYKWLNKNNVK